MGDKGNNYKNENANEEDFIAYAWAWHEPKDSAGLEMTFRQLLKGMIGGVVFLIMTCNEEFQRFETKCFNSLKRKVSIV